MKKPDPVALLFIFLGLLIFGAGLFGGMTYLSDIKTTGTLLFYSLMILLGPLFVVLGNYIDASKED